MCPPVNDWLQAFLLTIALEFPIVFYLTRREPLALWRRIALIVFAQFVTHPFVWYIFPAIPGLRGFTAFVMSELWAWWGEALFYIVTSVAPRPLRAVGIAGLANGFSLGVGLLMMR